jgi:DNA topoisomerase 2-associated protein PAT1
MLHIFVSRVQDLKQGITVTEGEKPTQEELIQWYIFPARSSLNLLSRIYHRQLMFDHLFQLLAPHLLFLFPSVRQAVNANVAVADIPDSDLIDQPVWNFLSIVALHAVPEQQQVLVTALRERILENVASVSKGWVVDEEQQRQRLTNVNLFLHSLGLDSSQIAL